MKKIFTFLFLLLITAPVMGQSTKSALTTEINTNFPSNIPQAITAQDVRTTLIDMVNSWVDLNGQSSFNCPINQAMIGFTSLSQPLCGLTTATALANPTGAIGLTTVNGSASTAMRSDAAPALSSLVQTALTGTNNGVALGTGTFGLSTTSAGTNNQAFMGSTGTAPGFRSLISADLPTNGVTNSILAQMPADTVKCNPTGSTGAVQDCTNFFLQSVVAGQPATQVGNLNPLSFINQSSDNVSAGSGFIEGFAANYAFGGSSMQGGRIALLGQFQQTAATSSSSTNRNYEGVQGTALTQSGDGGSAPSAAGGKGAYFAYGGNTFVNAAATNLFEVAGGEVDTDVQSGASMAYLLGWTIVGNNAVQGSVLDAAVEIGGDTDSVYGPHIGWNYGFVFSDIHTRSPVNSNSTLFGGFFPTLGTQTIKHGIDLSSFTCSSDCFKSTGFSVSGVGSVSIGGGSPSTTDALDITENLNGAAHNGLSIAQTVTGNIAANGFNYNLINITSDNGQCGNSGFCNGFTVQDIFGGAAMVGGRQAIQATVTLTAPSSATNGNRNYVAGFFGAAAQTGDNGTNTGAGALGGVFAMNPVAQLLAGATNFLEVSGGEVNFGMDSTASTKYMLGWTVIAGYNGGSNGSGTAASMGAGVSVSGIVPQTLDAAYIVSDLNSGWPIKTGGVLQRAFITGATPTVTHGTDWSAVTFTGCAFKQLTFCVGSTGSLTVSGAFGASLLVNFQNTTNAAGSGGVAIGAGVTSPGADTTTNLILFEDGAESTGLGTVKRNGTGVTFNTSSDRRLKDNFRQSSVGLNDLMHINVQDFNFIGSSNVVNGFVAQDLFQIYPWAVSKGGDDPKKDPWGVDYGRLTPLLVKSTQDMQHEIEALTSRVATLEQRASARPATRSLP